MGETFETEWQSKDKKEIIKRPFKRLLVEGNNVIKPEIFDLFPNCKHILIYATDTWGAVPFEFDLLALRDVLDSKIDHIKANNIKITIVGKWHYTNLDDDIKNISSWVREAWGKCQHDFNQGAFNAVLEKKREFKFDHEDASERWEDQLIITVSSSVES